MKIYNYHPTTGEFLNATLADPDPKNPSNFLIPAYATSKSPPIKKEGYALVYINDKWENLIDKRGKSYWNEKGELITISEIGLDIPINAYLEKPDLRTDTEKQKDFSILVRSEVSRRIFLHASANTQMNMTAAATAGLLSEDQMQAYRDALFWVSKMRAKGAELIANNAQDYFDDKYWPEPSDAAVALVNAF